MNVINRGKCWLSPFRQALNYVIQRTTEWREEMADKEIEALSKVAQALEGLNEEAVKRVLAWAAARHNVPPGKTPVIKTTLESAENGFSDFADLYDAANPQFENDKVLVAAYWVQELQKTEEWDSQSLNDLLKNLGHTVSNITRTLDRLQAEKPRLAMQTLKTGKTKQGRKRYKLTVEGIKKVKKMLTEPASEN